MGDKMTCPGCNWHSSTVLFAVRDNRPCPGCGLDPDTIEKVNRVREARADESLKAELSAALIQASKAEANLQRFREFEDAVREALQILSDGKS